MTTKQRTYIINMDEDWTPFNEIIVDYVLDMCAMRI